YEKSRGFSINYCDTPKFQMDSVLKQFSDAHYKNKYENEVKGHYIGIEEMKNEVCQLYKSDYEDIKTRCFFPQTITPEYEAGKKLHQCNDVIYRQHPDTVKFTQVVDSPVQVQAAINAKQLSDVCTFFGPLPLGANNCYKYDWEKTKAKKFEIKGDTISILAARAHTNAISDVKYKKEYEKNKGKMVGALSINDDPKMLHSVHVAKIQSDREYKKDYEKVKTKYHTPLDMLSVTLAKKSQAISSMAGYRSISTNYFLPPDSVLLDLAKKANVIQSDNEYKADYNSYTKGTPWVPYGSLEVEKAKKAAEILNEVCVQHGFFTSALMVQYKKAYEKARGHHVGFRSLQDDPLMQSDKNYKKDYHKAKLKYHTPVDMLSVVQAKHASAVQTYIGYKQHHHKYFLLPDAMGLQLARTMNYNSSDHNYKMDYETSVKGIGWVPIGSLEVEKAKTAAAALNEKKYRQHPQTIKFTSATDSMSMELAKTNAKIMNYKASGEKFMHTYNLPPDAPQFLQARYNAANISQNYYTYSHRQDLLKGHHMKEDSIPIVAAKTSRNIASNYKYKLAYEKEKGHHVGFRSLQDDPLLVHYMQVAKMQSDKNYKKDYHKAKLKYHTPVDMLSVAHAKQASAVQTMIFSKYPQNVYKSDYNSYSKGIGWVPIGSLDVEKAKTAKAALDERNYRQHPSNFKYTSKTDAMNMTLAMANTKQMDITTYKASGEKFMHTYHLPSDCPEFLQAKFNAQTISESHYRHKWVEDIAKGYDMKPDAIPILHAKHGRHIASNVQYKKAYEKARGHHVGFRSLQDDPLLKCQIQVNDFNYRTHLHQWTCLPDSNDVVQARHAYDLQSDAVYKADLKWLQGLGWVPIGSLDVEKAKKAAEVLSERKYRQHPSKVPFTSPVDAMNLVLAKNNALTMNKVEFFIKDFQSHFYLVITFIVLSQQNAITMSKKLYRQGYEETIKKGYFLPVDAISVKAAKASREIISDVRYRKQVGHHIGARSIHDDPLVMLALNSAKIASDALYKKDFNKSKTKTHLHQWTCLPDSNDVVQARKAYDLQSDAVYKADLDEVVGVGWIPIGSLDVLKAKNAAKILSDRLYNILICFLQKAYIAAWENDKTNIHVMPDTPEIILAQQNKLNTSLVIQSLLA
uniref:SH3 domain-containing protein n=1 Tax=Haplochromis burtoni TaxID=8153 RepID=A0A3Q2WR30_HAPBU